MVWSYLSEFWNSITSVVITGGEYTVDWFQSIGNAVAGGVGAIFDGVFHLILDAFTAVGYITHIFFVFFKGLIRPFEYFFSYLSSGITSLFSPMNYTTDLSWQLPTNIIEVFEAIPYWSVFAYSLTAIILFLVGYKIFRLIIKI